MQTANPSARCGSILATKLPKFKWPYRIPTESLVRDTTGKAYSYRQEFILSIDVAFDKNGKRIAKGDKVRDSEGGVANVRAIRVGKNGKAECKLTIIALIAVGSYWCPADELERV